MNNKATRMAVDRDADVFYYITMHLQGYTLPWADMSDATILNLERDASYYGLTNLIRVIHSIADTRLASKAEQIKAEREKTEPVFFDSCTDSMMTIKASAPCNTPKSDEAIDGYEEYPNQEEVQEEKVPSATRCTQSVFQMFDPLEPCLHRRRTFSGADDEIRRIFEDIELFNPHRDDITGQDEWFRL